MSRPGPPSAAGDLDRDRSRPVPFRETNGPGSSPIRRGTTPCKNHSYRSCSRLDRVRVTRPRHIPRSQLQPASRHRIPKRSEPGLTERYIVEPPRFCSIGLARNPYPGAPRETCASRSVRSGDARRPCERKNRSLRDIQNMRSIGHRPAVRICVPSGLTRIRRSGTMIPAISEFHPNRPALPESRRVDLSHARSSTTSNRLDQR